MSNRLTDNIVFIFEHIERNTVYFRNSFVKKVHPNVMNVTNYSFIVDCFDLKRFYF